ncbi:MAG: Thiosulfate sulfurtransferase GlpE [Microgenomates bacterium OLB23]|nr:MAG: Thiosulfate sulfurtransferase GlpE [Microgenomates bacterium OLB23]
MTQKSLLLLFGISTLLTITTIVVYHLEPVIKLPESLFTKARDVVYADPYLVLSELARNNAQNVLLVDMRSPQDYQARRLKNSQNIYFPYVTNRDEEKEFVKAVEKQSSLYKKIVLLPYSAFSTSGEDAARILLEAGFTNVFVLKAGWNELYSLPNMWVPEEKVADNLLQKLIEED